MVRADSRYESALVPTGLNSKASLIWMVYKVRHSLLSRIAAFQRLYNFCYIFRKLC